MSCDAVFGDEEWRAVYLVTQRKPPPEQLPSLDTMVRMVASLGGFLNRKREMASRGRKRSGSVYKGFRILCSPWRPSAVSGRLMGSAMGLESHDCARQSSAIRRPSCRCNDSCPAVRLDRSRR
ncbi:IS4 family transposase [Thiorhodovibrio litoralis]|nr:MULTISPECIES: IS4 family transposase [Thiorhodovibrio]